MVETIQEVLESNTSKVYILESNESVEITPDLAKKIATVHDSLNTENQRKLRYLVTKDSENFTRMAQFCTYKCEE
jgi:hypothetical protein